MAGRATGTTMKAKAKAKTPRAKGKGINVHRAMEWLYRLLLLGQRREHPEQATFSDDPMYYGGGSPNMKLLYAVTWWAWALVVGTAAAVHRNRVKNILERERRCHGQGEPTTSSHGQLWLAGVATALFLAEKYADPEIRDLAIEWLRVEHAIHRATESDGEMWCPGGRGTTKPLSRGGVALGSNPATPKMWGAITTGKPKGKANQYDLGAWLIAQCSEEAREQIREWPRHFPPMAGALHVRRYDDSDFVAWYDSLEGVSDATLSAGVLRGERWVSLELDQDKLDAYAGRSPVLVIDTEATDSWRGPRNRRKVAAAAVLALLLAFAPAAQGTDPPSIDLAAAKVRIDQVSRSGPECVSFENLACSVESPCRRVTHQRCTPGGMLLNFRVSVNAHPGALRVEAWEAHPSCFDPSARHGCTKALRNSTEWEDAAGSPTSRNFSLDVPLIDDPRSRVELVVGTIGRAVLEPGPPPAGSCADVDALLPTVADARQRIDAALPEAPPVAAGWLHVLRARTDEGIVDTMRQGLVAARCFSGGGAGPRDPRAVPAEEVKGWLLALADWPGAPPILSGARWAIAETPAGVLRWGYVVGVEFKRRLPFRSVPTQ